MTYKVGTQIKHKRGHIRRITKVTKQGYEWTREGLNYSLSSLHTDYEDPWLVDGWSVYVPEKPALKAGDIRLIRLALQIAKHQNRESIAIVSRGTHTESHRRVREWIKKDAKTFLGYERDFSGYLQEFMYLINKHE